MNCDSVIDRADIKTKFFHHCYRMHAVQHNTTIRYQRENGFDGSS